MPPHFEVPIDLAPTAVSIVVTAADVGAANAATSLSCLMLGQPAFVVTFTARKVRISASVGVDEYDNETPGGVENRWVRLPLNRAVYVICTHIARPSRGPLALCNINGRNENTAGTGILVFNVTVSARSAQKVGGRRVAVECMLKLLPPPPLASRGAA
eukprot:3869629-Prymnesium_polylepis.1